MKNLISLAHLWFDDFKWKQFLASLVGVFLTAMWFLAQISVPASKQQPIAWVIVGIAAVMYILNPKNRDWSSDTGEGLKPLGDSPENEK